MISLIIPAHNEADLIGGCLASLLASENVPEAEIIVAANGCRDQTVARAEACRDQIEARGWSLTVLDLPEGGKPGALNAADRVARFDNRAYIDADVTLDRDLLARTLEALAQPQPRYVSGMLRVSAGASWITRAYGRLYRRLPFITEGVPGAGFFAVNAQGRARWGAFPQIISDDTFVRLSFTRAERIRVAAGYDWPLVEGWANLVRVRRRQNVGVAEVYDQFPHLEANADEPGVGKLGALRLFLAEPIGFVIYAAVSVATRFGGATGWSRGR